MYCLFNCSEPSEQFNRQYKTTLEPIKHQHIQPSLKKKEINTPVQKPKYKKELQDIFQVLYAAYLSITPRHDNKVNEFCNSFLTTFTFYLLQFTWHSNMYFTKL